MAVWSSVFHSTGQKLLKYAAVLPKGPLQRGQVRCMSEERIFRVEPSRWQWHKTKDYLHLYAMIGLIPVGIIVFCSYIFVGPAQLEEIPDGYTPKQYEYYRNPISRFLCKYLYTTRQQEYEKYLNVIYNEQRAVEYRKLNKRVRELAMERRDHESYAFRPYLKAKYIYRYKELEEQEQL